MDSKLGAVAIISRVPASGWLSPGRRNMHSGFANPLGRCPSCGRCGAIATAATSNRDRRWSGRVGSVERGAASALEESHLRRSALRAVYAWFYLQIGGRGYIPPELLNPELPRESAPRAARGIRR
jgi:hypothetical protein